MSGKHANTAVVGVGAAACAVCCAGPIIGFLTAIGLGTALGFALFGALALALGAIAVVVVVVARRRRRDRSVSCDVAADPVDIAMPTVRTRS